MSCISEFGKKDKSDQVGFVPNQSSPSPLPPQFMRMDVPPPLGSGTHWPIGIAIHEQSRGTRRLFRCREITTGSIKSLIKSFIKLKKNTLRSIFSRPPNPSPSHTRWNSACLLVFSLLKEKRKTKKKCFVKYLPGRKQKKKGETKGEQGEKKERKKEK